MAGLRHLGKLFPSKVQWPLVIEMLDYEQRGEQLDTGRLGVTPTCVDEETVPGGPSLNRLYFSSREPRRETGGPERLG